MTTCLDQIAYDIHNLMLARGMYRHAVQLVRDPVLGDVEGRVSNPSFNIERLCYIHSEVSEALDAHRDGDDEKEALELADVILRTLDYAKWRGFNMDHAVAAKLDQVRARKDQRPASPAAAAAAR